MVLETFAVLATFGAITEEKVLGTEDLHLPEPAESLFVDNQVHRHQTGESRGWDVDFADGIPSSVMFACDHTVEH